MGKNKKLAFTLIEVMVGIIITSIILIVSFDFISKISYGKIKLIDYSNIEKESFFFSQRLYETIKKGGTIDYEEYWNRKIVGNTIYSSGHYNLRTGFGNFGKYSTRTDNSNVGSTNYGNTFYYCRSGDGVNMGTGGCVHSNNDGDGYVNTTGDKNIDYSGNPQRYGEYSFQFIDFNSNKDSDLGDEDGNNNIFKDYDDEYLGNGPSVFNTGSNVKELYLISADKIHRTFLRLNYIIDPNAPVGANCTTNDGGITYIGTGCLGRIEILKLVGKDWGMDHVSGNSDSDGTEYDGVVDTWLIDPDYTGGTDVIAGSNNTNYWLPLFSGNINVKLFEVYVFPNKDIKRSWKDNLDGTNFSPYIKLNILLSPSWKIKRRVKGKIPEFNYSTTISLLDIYSR